MRRIVAVLIAVFLFAPAAWACWCPPPDTYSFNVSLEGVAVDEYRSAANTLGFDNWYVWKYKIEVDGDGTDILSGATLKHWVLELPTCYLTSPDLFQEIEASAGWGRPDKVSVYDPEAIDSDADTELSGMKWAFQSSCHPYSWPLGEWWWFGQIQSDYFWFSAPTNVSSDTDWGIKAGLWCYKEVVNGTVAGPACPPSALIPEPTSLVLMGAGIVGLVIRNRKRGIV